MDDIGINSRLREVILTPGCDDMRGTASCRHWVLEAIEMRFEALDNFMDHIFREYERRQSIVESGDREKQ